MFGTNEIVGKKFFKDAPAGTLKVTSMFLTLQGEGPYGGQPSFFIRLAHCNLDCSFCDTMFDAGDVLTFEQIEQRIFDYTVSFYQDQGFDAALWAVPRSADSKGIQIGPYGFGLVVTGGEPLLQDNLVAFLDRMKGKFKFIQIESNGTIEQPLGDHITYVCSPKCAEKDGRPTRYLKPSQWLLDRADCLKFVMSAEPGNPYSSIPEWAHEWKARTGKEVYVSPMNVYNQVPQKIKLVRASKEEITMAERSTVDEVISFWEPGLLNMEQNRKNHEYAARYCMNHGMRMNLQVHLYASLA